MDRVNAKIASRATVNLFIEGDSISAGVGGGADGGWPNLLTKRIALENDYNWSLRVAPTGGAYGSVTTYTTSSEGPSGPMVNLYLTGVSGSAASTMIYTTVNNSVTLPVDPDLVIMGWGVNDKGALNASGAVFTANMQTLYGRIKTLWGTDTPVLIETENPASGYNGHTTEEFRAFFSVMTNTIVGQSMPLTPSILASPTVEALWVIDTWPAYGNEWSSALIGDVVHPTPAGHAAQADYMYEQLTSGIPTGDPPVITTTSLNDGGALAVGSSFSETLTATGAPSWAVHTGTPPAGLTLSPTGVLSGTPTASGAYDFTVRATNDFGHADQRYTGTVEAIAIVPFTPTGIARLLVKLDGDWYPVKLKVKDGGVWKPVVLRH